MDRRHSKFFQKKAFFFNKRLSCKINLIQLPITRDDGSAKWVTLTDIEQTEKLPIENNNKYFSQAEGTSLTRAPLTNILGDGMSETCNKVLYDTCSTPTTLPHLVQEYLKNIKRDNNIPQELNPIIQLN